jgi:3-oxoacyl-[acyl-carrier protein] reductase
MAMDLGLAGKNVLVTGGSHGIGERIAMAFADEGSNVAICARNQANIDLVIEKIRRKGVSALGIAADVLVAEDVQNVVDTIIDRWGTIHILINNVGGGGRWGSEVIEDTPERVWTDVYSKNALAAIRFTMKVLPYMRMQRWGKVVTVSSIFGREGGGRPWYNMAKSSEISLMKSLSMRKDLVRDGITFNSVTPGKIMIAGTGWQRIYEDDREQFNKETEEIPLGRFGTPEEVASLILFICSEKAGFVNGSCIVIDGGESKSF